MPVLRDVAEADLDVFYEQQRDPEAAAMAVFPARDRDAFDAHWRRVLADDWAVKRTIVDGGADRARVRIRAFRRRDARSERRSGRDARPVG